MGNDFAATSPMIIIKIPRTEVKTGLLIKKLDIFSLVMLFNF
jgi:hypothetical protein